MKEITIEKYTATNKRCADLIKRDVNDEIDKLKVFLNTVFVYVASVEDQNERLKTEKSKLYAENCILRKQLELKDKKEEKPNELDEMYKKLKELRAQKVKWEEELDRCMEFVQNQYDDLK